MIRTLTVELGDRSYPIHVGDGLLDLLGEYLYRASLRGRVAVVTNPTVGQLYLERVKQALAAAGFESTSVIVPDGEEHKSLDSLAGIYDHLIGARLERRSCLVALGGGVVGDLAGFAAATYLRGVPYVQVPTTLLAQVDSSVGGKTAVNHRDGKNLIGAFYQPRLVLIDTRVLDTLPRRELVAGLAEVIKYGVIEDTVLFHNLENSMDRLIGLEQELLTQVIADCCAIKARVVEQDEREDDYRAVLNFGHTLGHALEAATDYGRFLHGEAVGIGMVKAAEISLRHGFCDRECVDRIRGLVEKTGLPANLPQNVSPEALIQGLEVDKKSAAGKIKFVMCAEIGKTRFHNLSPAEILACLRN